MRIKKIAVILLTLLTVVLFVSLGISTAKSSSKNRNPESIVTCQVVPGDYLVLARTAPVSINLNGCSTYPAEDECAPCIRSLESQGCRVVDVVVTNYGPSTQDGTIGAPPRATFLLSCERP